LKPKSQKILISGVNTTEPDNDNSTYRRYILVGYYQAILA